MFEEWPPVNEIQNKTEQNIIRTDAILISLLLLLHIRWVGNSLQVIIIIELNGKKKDRPKQTKKKRK